MSAETKRDIPRTLHVNLADGTRDTLLLTDHARDRIREMGASLYDVARVGLDPHSWYLGSDRSGRTRVNRREDCDIALVVNPVEKVVVTCLWATTEDYTREEKA